MKTFPLKSINIVQAQKKQFLLVDIITKHFSGADFLTLGDLGINTQAHKPLRTAQVEKVIAEFFMPKLVCLRAVPEPKQSAGGCKAYCSRAIRF